LQTYHTIWYEEEKRIRQKEEQVMALLTKRRWLKEGLALLEEAGAEALTIEGEDLRALYQLAKRWFEKESY
jgi:hypothetical protein